MWLWRCFHQPQEVTNWTREEDTVGDNWTLPHKLHQNINTLQCVFPKRLKVKDMRSHRARLNIHCEVLKSCCLMLVKVVAFYAIQGTKQYKTLGMVMFVSRPTTLVMIETWILKDMFIYHIWFGCPHTFEHVV